MLYFAWPGITVSQTFPLLRTLEVQFILGTLLLQAYHDSLFNARFIGLHGYQPASLSCDITLANSIHSILQLFETPSGTVPWIHFWKVSPNLCNFFAPPKNYFLIPLVQINPQEQFLIKAKLGKKYFEVPDWPPEYYKAVTSVKSMGNGIWDAMMWFVLGWAEFFDLNLSISYYQDLLCRLPSTSTSDAPINELYAKTLMPVLLAYSLSRCQMSNV